MILPSPTKLAVVNDQGVEDSDVAANLTVVGMRAGPDSRVDVLIDHAVVEVEVRARIVVGLVGRVAVLRAVDGLDRAVAVVSQTAQEDA